MLDTLKAGQKITCTITAMPRSAGGISTIERLMRRDPDLKRSLRKGQKRRLQNLNVYNRGNRDWTSRVRCGKVVRVEKGESWNMLFTNDLTPEFNSVAEFVKIKAA